MHTARMFRNLLMGMLVTQGISTNIGLADAYHDGPKATLDSAGKPAQRRIAHLSELPLYSPPPAAAVNSAVPAVTGGMEREGIVSTISRKAVPTTMPPSSNILPPSVSAQSHKCPRAGRTLVIEEETNPGLIGRLRGQRITRVYQELPEWAVHEASQASLASVSQMYLPVDQAARRTSPSVSPASEGNRQPVSTPAARTRAPVTEDEVLHARRKADAERQRQLTQAKPLINPTPRSSLNTRQSTNRGDFPVDPEIRTIGHDELLAVAPLAGQSGIEVQQIIERVYEENEKGELVLVREIHYEAR